MRRVRGIFAGLVAAAMVFAVFASPASASVEERSLSEGGFGFPEIRDATAPEEYAYRLDLTPEQHLEEIASNEIGVFYEDGSLSITFSNPAAHDAQGATVPTSLVKSGPKRITLTVQYLDGNPAAGGAPFAFPIAEGPGWAGGYHVYGSEMNEPHPAAPAPAATSTPRVLVVNSLVEQVPRYRPHRFFLSADGTFGVDRVKWESYGGAVATAGGRAYANSCDPDCADGHYFKPGAKLRLTKVVECGGEPLYSRLSYRLSGPLPAGFPRRGSLRMLPLSEDGKPDC